MFGILCGCCCSWTVAIAVVSVALYALSRYVQGGQFTKNTRLESKVAIITGANGGIGLETARDFARRGARVYIACRNVVSGQEARDEIVRDTGNESVFVAKLDLSSLQSVRDFVAAFLTIESRLDLLINNAGVCAIADRQLTADGYEMQFGTNHLGHFLLTTLLLDALKAAAPSRIVTVSSIAHSFADRLQRDNLNGEREYGRLNAYNQSKLANVLFTRELAKRLRDTGVVANSLHPGAVRSGLGRNWSLTNLIGPFKYVLMKSARSGAQTQIAVAVDPELERVSGKYFSDCAVKEESMGAQSDADAAWLWEQSERMVKAKSH